MKTIQINLKKNTDIHKCKRVKEVFSTKTVMFKISLMINNL